MNKWYRLGQEFNKKFTKEQFFEILRNNNYTNALGCIGKDFKEEKDYKKLCEMVGIPEETEDKHYNYGERKYYFYQGYDKK
jgi:hypothetical protein